MADNNVTDYPRALHPLHAILLAFPLPLFLGALLSDLAYSSTYEVQWTNFASWLIAGAMLTGALVTLWALIECLVSGRQRTGKHFAYLIVLLVMLTLDLDRPRRGLVQVDQAPLQALQTREQRG